jgi:hypothetical protein
MASSQFTTRTVRSSSRRDVPAVPASANFGWPKV